MPDYNAGRRWIKARRGNLVGHLPGRAESICGVFVHATRSGRFGNDDGPGTENWGNHPGNPGGFQDIIIGGTGQQVQCCRWDLNEQPLWAGGDGGGSTWNAQQYYLHVEVSQGTIDSPFTEESIESAAQFTAEQSRIYGFEIVRIPFLAQVGVPPEGICDHQNSANGRKLGKSDPGPLWPWDRFIARARELAQQEDGMTDDQVKEIVRAILRDEVTELGASRDQVMDALVRRQRAMGRAATLADVIKANDPQEVPA